MIFVKTSPMVVGVATLVPHGMAEVVSCSPPTDVLWRHGGLYRYFSLEKIQSFSDGTKSTPRDTIILHWAQGKAVTADEAIEMLVKKVTDDHPEQG
jgi:hypothetical protein